MILYRTAGIPAYYVLTLPVRAKAAGHLEAGYYLNGVWWVTAGRNYGDGKPISLIDYTANPTVTTGIDYRVPPTVQDDYAYRLATNVVKPDPTGQKDIIYDFIIDLDEPWVRPNVEEDFMNHNLFYSQFIHNGVPLTRGEVARLLCNYLNIAPMRNEQIFLDVKSDDTNSHYIWAVNRMGIMTGDDNNQFHPDSELTMQEFAAIAARIVDWGEQRLSDLIIVADNGSTVGAAHIMTTPEQRLEKLKAAKTSGKPKTFADANKIASWAKPAVDKLSSLGILSGDDNGYLKPTDTLDRLRFAILLYKLDVNFGNHGEGLITGLNGSVVF
ncbi:MAG: S-layer homology domain-containing protein [Syntrophomonadaceae bacterium]|nr:S-layer homology domain-containing protein [Syntrophomonadaceae bacterium]